MRASRGQETGISLWTAEQSSLVLSVLAESVSSTAIVTRLLYATENTHNEHWPHCSQARKKHSRKWFSTHYWNLHLVLQFLCENHVVKRVFGVLEASAIHMVGDADMSPVQNGLVVPSWVSREVLTSTSCGLSSPHPFWRDEGGRKTGTSRKELRGRSCVGAPDSQREWCCRYSSLSVSDISLQDSSSGWFFWMPLAAV